MTAEPITIDSVFNHSEQALNQIYLDEIARLKHWYNKKDAATLETAQAWVKCTSRSHPIIAYYVAKRGEQVIGYVCWEQKSGYREDAAMELEDVLVDEQQRIRGVGTRLVRESLIHYIQNNFNPGQKLSKVRADTRTTNLVAQRLYRKALGLRVKSKKQEPGSGPSYVMAAGRAMLQRKLQIPL